MTEKIPDHLTANAIRQTFIQYFEEHGHTFVPSSSLVPGGDDTLLFTNSGMVQFKDVFLGTDKRPYTRAVNSQKSMRVAGKHNDLDDVGRDDTHHTFFEMLGNWSFGDYYKEQAILWAWDLLTNVWGLPKEQLYATCFKDELGEIPTDEEAAEIWRKQQGFNPNHLFYLGRADNFWEMAETGPCGPNSEIHLDLRPHDGPVRVEDLDTDRFLELWNLVFIQYNRTGPNTLEPLKAKHVDTGMGLERIVQVLQKKNSNYRTDMLWPLIAKTQELTGHSDADREAHFTAYRVIADHGRAATFLIADGVNPGNQNRNYVTRMIIRRAYRFGRQVGLREPFLGSIAEVVIQHYGEAYPELRKNRQVILSDITREEEQFQRTLDRAMSLLEKLLDDVEGRQGSMLDGAAAADLFTTHGLPFEITRDVARERGLDVDEAGYRQSMAEHRDRSVSSTASGLIESADTDQYARLLEELQSRGDLGPEGVVYDPYGPLERTLPVLALLRDGETVQTVSAGDRVELLLPATSFYTEAGGQVDDTGWIMGAFDGPSDLPQNETSRDSSGAWKIRIDGMRRPAAGVIVHRGEVLGGRPRVGDPAIARVDAGRRQDIMRNHTATHLLHAALNEILGEHARQAGSLVAPDRLRFDFTHPEAVKPQELEKLERLVNERILENHALIIAEKPRQQALDEGVRALFGEKYGEIVRTIRIGDFSYELCGGTHCMETNDIGLFTITSESSVAAGTRRIIALTGREAYRHFVQSRHRLQRAAEVIGTHPDRIEEGAQALVDNLVRSQREVAALREQMAAASFGRVSDAESEVAGVKVLTTNLEDSAASVEALRTLADRWRERNPQNSVAVLASIQNDRPILVAAVTQDLVPRGLRANDLAGHVARQLGGGGGGSPTLAQAGGKDASKLDQALSSVAGWVEANLE